jgi:hypothetical protein
MKSIDEHIRRDKELLNDPLISGNTRRHLESELAELESYKENNPEDHHDPTSLELFCDSNPEAEECRIYDD